MTHTVEGTQHTLTVTALDEALLMRNATSADRVFSRTGRLIDDEELQAYFDGVLKRLLVARGKEGTGIRVRGIDDKEINAFALPNGSIYFNSGLIALLENEDEFAAVLAHEVEHVLGRHIVRGNRAAFLQVILLAIGFSALKTAVDAPPDTVDSVRLAEYFATRAYSRRLEKKADLSSIHALHKAGYDPRAMAAALERMAAADRSRDQRGLGRKASHPAVKDRIRYCRREVNALRSAPRTAPTRGPEDPYRSLVAAALPGKG